MAQKIQSQRYSASELFRSQQGKICDILDDSDETLQSLTVDLFSNHVISKQIKNKVIRDKGYSGANLLVDMVSLKLEQTPRTLEKVFKIMRRQIVLYNVVKDMQLATTTNEQDEDMETSTLPTFSAEMDEKKIVSEARALQEAFQDRLVEIRRQLRGIDVEDLRLRLNTHLSCEGENTPEIKQILLEIDQIAEPSNILNHLVRNNMIGYLNYRLLYVFKKSIKKREIDMQIKMYEDAHDQFLQLTHLGILAKVFEDNPALAPLTHVGLPRFEVHLNKAWEQKGVYQWNELLNKKFNWPPHIHIARINRGSIIIVYNVLPFFVSAVVRDLTDLPVISLLEGQGIKVELSDDFIKLGIDPIEEFSTESEIQEEKPSVYHRSGPRRSHRICCLM